MKEFGFRGVEDFGAALVEIKAEHFAEWSIDELTSRGAWRRSSTSFIRNG